MADALSRAVQQCYTEKTTEGRQVLKERGGTREREGGNEGGGGGVFMFMLAYVDISFVSGMAVSIIILN